MQWPSQVTMQRWVAHKFAAINESAGKNSSQQAEGKMPFKSSYIVPQKFVESALQLRLYCLAEDHSFKIYKDKGEAILNLLQICYENGHDEKALDYMCQFLDKGERYFKNGGESCESNVSDDDKSIYGSSCRLNLAIEFLISVTEEFSHDAERAEWVKKIKSEMDSFVESLLQESSDPSLRVIADGIIKSLDWIADKEGGA